MVFVFQFEIKLVFLQRFQPQYRNIFREYYSVQAKKSQNHFLKSHL